MTQLPISFSGRYVTTCYLCGGNGRVRWMGKDAGECIICQGSGKVIRERKPTDMNGITVGPAPAGAELGPIQKGESDG